MPKPNRNRRIADDFSARCQYARASREPVEPEEITRLLFKVKQRATFGGSWTSTARLYENGVQVAVDKVASDWSLAKCLGIYVKARNGVDIRMDANQKDECLALLRTKYQKVDAVDLGHIIYLIKPHA